MATLAKAEYTRCSAVFLFVYGPLLLYSFIFSSWHGICLICDNGLIENQQHTHIDTHTAVAVADRQQLYTDVMR